MPDSFEHTPTIAMRMPNGALGSLAGNLDPHHDIAIADLILAQTSVRATVERLVRDQQPDVVGLSVMTFQRPTARRIIGLVRSLAPNVRIVVGGYDPSLAPHEWTHPDLGVDVIVRGEGDVTFREADPRVRGGDGARRDRRHLVSRGRLVSANPPARDRVAQGRCDPVTKPRRARADRLHADGPSGGRRRDLTRLHVRLQLLLDHRDARAELPSLLDRPRDRGHRRRQGAVAHGPSFSWTTTSRSTWRDSRRSARQSSPRACTISTTWCRR